jgi:hypothetical protein
VYHRESDKYAYRDIPRMPPPPFDKSGKQLLDSPAAFCRLASWAVAEDITCDRCAWGRISQMPGEARAFGNDKQIKEANVA